MTRKLSRELWDTLKAVSLVIGSHELDDEAHPTRIAGYARMLGEEMGLDAEEVEQIEYAVLLHDIGQIKVRETILKKPGRLTREEFFEVQAHPMESEKIINMMPNLEKAAQWTRWHHEWWDGSGYPDRLQGAAIPMPSRILSVTDAFGAMLCDRPYRSALSPDDAITELKLMAGIQFDPGLVTVFEKIHDKMISGQTDD
jgi:HD-GYP domain-containing protein (c-di-GMP phosphodiesterase class II)